MDKHVFTYRLEELLNPGIDLSSPKPREFPFRPQITRPNLPLASPAAVKSEPFGHTTGRLGMRRERAGRNGPLGLKSGPTWLKHRHVWQHISGNRAAGASIGTTCPEKKPWQEETLPRPYWRSELGLCSV